MNIKANMGSFGEVEISPEDKVKVVITIEGIGQVRLTPEAAKKLYEDLHELFGDKKSKLAEIPPLKDPLKTITIDNLDWHLAEVQRPDTSSTGIVYGSIPEEFKDISWNITPIKGE